MASYANGTWFASVQWPVMPSWSWSVVTSPVMLLGGLLSRLLFGLYRPLAFVWALVSTNYQEDCGMKVSRTSCTAVPELQCV